MTLTPEEVARLAATMTIDLTTYGRKSGNPARIEIWWFHVEDRFIITGTPGKRDWMANILADPRVIIHTAWADLTGTAELIEDTEFRRRVFTNSSIGWYKTQTQLERLVDLAPMIEIRFD